MTTKGMIAGAEVAQIQKMEFGVRTEWAVVLHFQSPTGDSSDFLSRYLPCMSQKQAQDIADKWNYIAHVSAPEFYDNQHPVNI